MTRSLDFATAPLVSMARTAMMAVPVKPRAGMNSTLPSTTLHVPTPGWVNSLTQFTPSQMRMEPGLNFSPGVGTASARGSKIAGLPGLTTVCSRCGINSGPGTDEGAVGVGMGVVVVVEESVAGGGVV